MKTPDGKDTNVPSKTSEEIKKANECCASVTSDCNGCPYEEMPNFVCFKQKCLDTLALIEQLEAQIPKWISVKERLPDEPCKLFMFLHDDVYAGRYLGGGLFKTYSGLVWSAQAGSVTHWMHRPDDPKEDVT